MTEEERRRCIILGNCGPGGEAATGNTHGLRRQALLEMVQENGGSVGEQVLDLLLSLIDEARRGEPTEH